MSIMLEPEDVDDGYFTPVASTTLASIFKDDSSNDDAVNPSLKYKPPQLKKSEETNKPDDAGASQCLFSCSLIAYEWVHGAHICKGKVGFAMVRTAKTGLCKVILYSPDKSTLSCTTVIPQLEVTQKDTMILLYDDLKKYWGLCFGIKNIEQFKELLKKENVIIKPYINPEFTKANSENLDSDEATDETNNSSVIEEEATSKRKTKASIMDRIANVGHAILPTLPGSPLKKISSPNITDTPDKSDKSTVLPDSLKAGDNNMRIEDEDVTKNIAIQTSQNNVQSNYTLSNHVDCSQASTASLPLVNNQIFTYINGYMVPLHMQVPVIDHHHCPSTCAEIELIIHKLTQLKGIVKTMETKCFQDKERVQTCFCKNEKLQSDLPTKDENAQTDVDLKHISNLEETIREKDAYIKGLQQNLNYLNEQMENIKQSINAKNDEMKQMILKTEADMHLASTVKNLMNNTFRSLSSNFDTDGSYTGNSIKGILATVIKKSTIESLNTLLSNQDLDFASKPVN